MKHFSQQIVAAPASAAGVNLKELCHIFIKEKLIAVSIMLVALLTSVIYALGSPALYRADALVNVSEQNDIIRQLMGETNQGGDNGTLDGEIKFINSSAVLEAAVREANLNINIQPHLLPLSESYFGRFLKSSHVIQQLLMRGEGYVRPGERLQIASLQVSPSLEGQPLRLIAAGGDRYKLYDGNNRLLLIGQAGVAAKIEGEDALSLFVRSLHAHPGAIFIIRKLSDQAVMQRIKNNLSVTDLGRQTGVIYLTLLGPNPMETERTLETIIQVYRQRSIEQIRSNALQALQLINQQMQQQMALPTFESRGKRAGLNAADFSSWRKKAIDLQMLAASTIGKVHILQHAEATNLPVKPTPSLIITFGLALGLMMGMLAAVIRHQFRGEDDPQRIEDHFNLPVFVSVPYSDTQAQLSRVSSANQSMKAPLLTHDAPNDLSVEYIRDLSITLQLGLATAKNNIIVVTGLRSGCGKSFIAANLALVLAQANKRVLLIDADLRQGNLHHHFGLPAKPGLAEALSSGDNVVQGTANRCLDLMATGALSAEPSSLLLHGKLHHLIEQLATRYEVVIIDTPGLLEVPDSLILSRFAATTLLILGAGRHSMAEVAQAIKQTRQNGVKVLGIVFNAVRKRTKRYARVQDEQL